MSESAQTEEKITISASDYKQEKLTRFHRSLIGWHNRRVAEHNEDLATHDGLTGLHNRIYFEERLRQVLLESRRTGIATSLLLLDIDRFKELNDSQGHEKGDEALKKLADILKSQLRESDTVARLSGDEFAVILPQTEGNSAMLRANQIRVFAEELLPKNTNTTVPLTTSIGVVEVGPTENFNISKIISHADLAMYNSKRDMDGTPVGNRVRMYTPDMQQPLQKGR